MNSGTDAGQMWGSRGTHGAEAVSGCRTAAERWCGGWGTEGQSFAAERGVALIVVSFVAHLQARGCGSNVALMRGP